MVFEPLDFIARLASLVPKPRVHLTRFHGVFAPNSKHRAKITGEIKEKQKQLAKPELSQEVESNHTKMNWAKRLKRVFNIDITVCRHCQGNVRIIACIEDCSVITQILAHINRQQKPSVPHIAVSSIRGPPMLA